MFQNHETSNSSIDSNDIFDQDLDKVQRYSLLKVISRCPKYTEDYILKLLDQERAISYSDLDEIEKLGIEASFPGLLRKDAIFKRYSNPPSQNSLNYKQLEASAKFFYNFDDRVQCEAYADKFFEHIENVFL